MKYFKKRRALITGQNNAGQTTEDDDPMSGVANLFDIGLVFIVGLIITLFSAFHLQDLFDEKAEFTILKKHKNGQMEIISKKKKQITAMKMTKEQAKGQGARLGVAYRLDDGSMVYVPD